MLNPSQRTSAARRNSEAAHSAGDAPNIRGKTAVFIILSGAKNLAAGHGTSRTRARVEIATADSSPPEGGSE